VEDWLKLVLKASERRMNSGTIGKLREEEVDALRKEVRKREVKANEQGEERKVP
jgi:hypothetical protein